MAEIDGELVKILRCPVTRAPLAVVGGWLYTTDAAAPRKYPIRDGIPVMLAEEAVEVDRAEFDRAMQQAGAAASS